MTQLAAAEEEEAACQAGGKDGPLEQVPGEAGRAGLYPSRAPL